MAIEADRVVVALEANLDDYTAKVNGAATTFERSTSRIEQSAAEAEGSIRRSHNAIAESTGNASGATLIFQSILRRTTDQIAAGAPISTILAEHVSGLAEAAELAGGSFGKFGEIMSGPWGIAISAAASVAGILASKLFEGGDAADDQGHKVKTLTQLINDLADAQDRANKSAEQSLIDLRNQSAAYVVNAARAHQAAVEALNKGLADAQVARDALGTGGATDAFSGAAQANAIAKADAQVKTIQARIVSTQADFTKAVGEDLNSKFNIALGNAKVATDKSAAATREYDRTVAHLREQQLGPTKLSQDALNSALIAAQEKLDAATGSAGRHATAHHHVADASREAAAAQRDLDSSLQSLLKDFDPVATAAKNYGDRLADIARLRAAGKITPEQADSFTSKAGLERYDDEQAAADKARDTLVSNLSVGFQQFIKSDPLKDLKVDPAVFRKIGDSFQPSLEAQDKIKSLATEFDQAFQGGTENIWSNFKKEGEAVIAQLLAQFAVTGKFNLGSALGAGGGGGGSGGVGSIFSALAGAIKGSGSGGSAGAAVAGAKASGGFVPAGTLVRVNEGASPGNVEGFIPQGAGKIIPLGEMANLRGGGTTIVHQHINVDGRNSVTPAEFARQIISIANDHADRAASSAYGSAVKAAPRSVQRAQTLGT